MNNIIQAPIPNPDAFGFTERNRRTIQATFSHFPSVKEVLLFGSRATGTHRPYSDVDFCITNPDFDQRQFLSIIGAFEESDLPFFVDVLVLHRLQNEDLKTRLWQMANLFTAKLCSPPVPG